MFEIMVLGILLFFGVMLITLIFGSIISSTIHEGNFGGTLFVVITLVIIVVAVCIDHKRGKYKPKTKTWEDIKEARRQYWLSRRFRRWWW